jgi:hypothetical protein
MSYFTHPLRRAERRRAAQERARDLAKATAPERRARAEQMAAEWRARQAEEARRMATPLGQLRARIAERAKQTAPLYRQLAELTGPDADRLPPEHRERRRKEIEADLARLNAAAAADVRQLAQEAAKEPRRLLATGTPLAADQLAEAGLLARQFEGRTTIEQRNLLADARQALADGAVDRARVLARAGQTLGVTDGQLDADLAKLDDVRERGRHGIDVIEWLVTASDADATRERVLAGIASPQESIADKLYAERNGIGQAQRGTSYVDQVLSPAKG